MIFFLYSHQGEPLDDNAMFLVFGKCLRLLLAVCLLCRKDCDVSIRRRMGTAVVFASTCKHCHHDREWVSQPQMSRLSLGNLKIAAGLFFSGCNPVKGLNMLRNVGVSMLSLHTYHAYQRLYLIPAIYDVWNRHRTAIVESAKAAGSLLRLAGDARCDSPGKSNPGDINKCCNEIHVGHFSHINLPQLSWYRCNSMVCCLICNKP